MDKCESCGKEVEEGYSACEVCIEATLSNSVKR